MSWLDGLSHRLRSFLFPGRQARELKDEFAFHLEQDERHHRLDAARARRRFGNPTVRREEVRAMTWGGRLDVIRQDLDHLRHAVLRDPGSVLLIVVTLSLGIGANAATFAVFDRAFLRNPAGVREPDGVRRFWIEHTRTGDGVPFRAQSLSYQMYRVLAGATGHPGNIALFATDFALHLGTGLSGPRVGAVYATSNYAQVLKVPIAQGRFFGPAEDRMGEDAGVVVVSHRFWLRHLQGKSAPLGDSITVGRRHYRVIGVMASGFIGLDLRAADLWIPLAAMPRSEGAGPRWWEEPVDYPFRAVARRPGGLEEPGFEERASRLMRSYQRETFKEHADTMVRVFVGPLIEARGPVPLGQDMVIMTRLVGVSVIVLLIALANVINLLLMRAEARRREIAVRLSLGIGRVRLVRLLILEALVLATIAGIGATTLGWAGGTVLRRLLFSFVEWTEPALDGRVALFTVAITFVAGLLAGIPPALQASRPNLTAALKSGARQGVRERAFLQRGLVVAQAALSVILLVGAALFVTSLGKVRALDLGYETRRLVVGTVEHADGDAPAAPAFEARARDVATRMAGVPGVEVVARTSIVPMWGYASTKFYTDRDSAESIPRPWPVYVSVTPEYFDAVGLRVVQGRTLSSEDGAPEVVIDEAMARGVWPGRNPMGQCLRLATRDAPCHTVVGVVGNSRLSYVIEPETTPRYYVRLDQKGIGGGPPGPVILARARPGTAALVARELRAELTAAFPGAAVEASTMRDRLDPEYRPWELGAILFSMSGALALVVAVVGLYSIVAYQVKRRTHEFGIRIALGAMTADVISQVVRSGVGTVAVGVALGLAISLAGGRLVSSMLFGVTAANPAVLAGVAAILLAAACFAAAVPAWRAARVDPAIALRDD